METNDTATQSHAVTMKSIVLLSGGMDSTTVLGIAKRESDYIEAITFNYGQVHVREIDQARKIADYYKVQMQEINFNFASKFNKSTIIYQGDKPLGNDYMPFRNMIIFSVACGYAQAHGFTRIYYGANADDVFPDNLEPFLIKFNESLDAMECGIKLVYPLMYLNKAGIIKKAIEVEAPLHLTRTCYLDGKKSCGQCLACQKRLAGFKEAGVIDPIEYK